MKHETFHYSSWQDVLSACTDFEPFLPYSENIKALFTPLAIGKHVSSNRVALQPMEGTDGALDGAPGELTKRRYIRFSEGGAGLIWFEAVASAPEVRASAHQLYLTDKNVDEFKKLVENIREAGIKKNGYAPVIVMQATNSGRYSKPNGYPEPLIAYNNPVLEDKPIDKSRILTDDQLKAYEEKFYDLARLAQVAGFDGMDVKCCHRYLANELFSAYTREGMYGGSFENRTRFIMNAYAAAQSAIKNPEFFLTSRMNAYDGFEYPWGFGVKEGCGIEPCMDEAIRLIGMITEKYNIPLINITIGNPYKNPHVNRPYDKGNYVPAEHPLFGESRMMKCVSEIQHAYPDLPVIGSAFTYLRGFSPNLAAGMIEGGHSQMAGFGRLAFAYPDFVNDLKNNGSIDPKKLCITCGQCANLLRAGIPAGCVVRDRDVYKPLS
ncbi:MAG: flavin oxidoreductase/NADH oxidase [Clostridiales bacterium]|nr:flavin oxidoreductase/NADH oxidase [Clostridiales bacterium]